MIKCYYSYSLLAANEKKSRVKNISKANVLTKNIRLRSDYIGRRALRYISNMGVIRHNLLYVNNIKRIHQISAKLKRLGVDHYVNLPQYHHRVADSIITSCNVNEKELKLI